MKKLKHILSHSIFRSVQPNASMNDILAVFFHRTSTTMYVFYGIWAVISIWTDLPGLSSGIFDFGHILFPIAVLITIVPSAIGATFWPSLARMELIFSSGFCTTILIYLYILLMNFLQTGQGLLGMALTGSIVILPAVRTALIFILLLRQAKTDKQIDGYL